MARKQQNNGPAFQEFDRRVRKLTAIGWDRQRAVASVAAKDPELHRQMVAETSTGTDPRVLQAVANGAESMVAPVQRSTSGQAKQTTAKSVAGTTTRQPATQATAIPAAPVAPVSAVSAATQTSAQAQLDAALAKRHAKGLDGSLAVLDLLKSPTEAHLWTDVKAAAACA